MALNRSLVTKVELVIWKLFSNGRPVEANKLRQRISDLTGQDPETLSKFEGYLDAFTFVTPDK